MARVCKDDGAAEIAWELFCKKGPSLINISQPTRSYAISDARFCFKKKKQKDKLAYCGTI